MVKKIVVFDKGQDVLDIMGKMMDINDVNVEHATSTETWIESLKTAPDAIMVNINTFTLVGIGITQYVSAVFPKIPIYVLGYHPDIATVGKNIILLSERVDSGKNEK